MKREYEAQHDRETASQNDSRRNTATRVCQEAEARAQAGETRRKAELALQQAAEQRLAPKAVVSTVEEAPSLFTRTSFTRWYA